MRDAPLAPRSRPRSSASPRTARALAALAAVAALWAAACAPVATGEDAGASHPDAQPEAAADAPAASTDDAASAAAPPADAPFVTAPHNQLPLVEALGGPSMHHVQLVVITYADDAQRAGAETFGQWLGTSPWLATVGADYGVGPGTLLGTVRRTDNAPDAISSTQIEAMIAAGIGDGSIPTPPDGDTSEVLYMVFFPAHTVVSLVRGGTLAPERSCQSFDGYHSEVRRSGAPHVAYAVVADCGAGRGGTELSAEQITASHEYIEAATDPWPITRPAWRIPTDGTSAWGLIGGEVADMCELTHSAYQTPEGYYVQRVWSNTAAMAGTDPCIPADPNRPYFNVTIDPADVQTASPGDTVTFTLTGWSVQPLSDWTLSVFQQSGSVMMTPTLEATRLNNGRQTTLTFTVPDTAQPGLASFVINSVTTTPRARQVWPVVIQIN